MKKKKEAEILSNDPILLLSVKGDFLAAQLLER